MAVRRHDMSDEPPEEPMHTHIERVTEPFGIAQGIALAMGVFFIVLGGIGLTRGGIDTMTSPRVEVLELGMTAAAVTPSIMRADRRTMI